MSPIRTFVLTSTALASCLCATAVHAAPLFTPGDLVVSYSVYSGTTSTVAIGQALPNSNGAKAIADGSYPGVFANDTVDANFGITAPILLQDVAVPNQITATSAPTLNVTAQTGITTSFPSKSELGLNLSSDGRTITLGGYNSPINRLDVSNSNTPAVIDPTNTDTAAPASRSIVSVDANGRTSVTNTNNYSGNNIRNAISAGNTVYTVGNSGNGVKATDSVTTPGSIGAALLATTGIQAVTPGTGASVQAGSFTGATDGYTLKDNNFRGETINNNTLYVSKGSGSNGINTVYQVGTAGTLPTATTTISVLPGFTTTPAGSQTCTVTNCSNYFAPFGLFFANPSTLYVADEGNAGTTLDSHAGLEKWLLVNGAWQLAYTLQSGLNLYTPYTVANYPATLDPYNTGLRDLTGRVNADGTVSLFAATSTNSASGDPGADPNSIVGITDLLAATALPLTEAFTIAEGPQSGVAFRGVAFAPVPEPASLGLLGGGLLAAISLRRRKRAAA